MNVELLRARQTKYALYLTLYVSVTLAIIVVANVLANRYNKSFDSTSNKRYSLSPQTAKIVKDLNKPVSITYFDQGTKFQQAKDLLDEYANLSPSVHIDYVDPDKEPEIARAAGVTSPGTTVVQIADRKEQAQNFTEEGITGAFIRDIKTAKRTVCFIEGSGEHRIDETGRSGYSRLKDLLGKDEYESKSADLVTKAEVPTDCTALVVGGPVSDYQQPEVDAIQKYIEGGGRALLLLDPPLKMGRTEVGDNVALNKMLEAWGVTPQNNLIIDFNPIGQIAGLGPQVALVTSYDPQPIVSDLKGSVIGFPLARSLDIKNGAKTTVDKLFSSTETSLATTNLSNPAIDPKDPKNVKGPLLMAAAGTYKTGKENSQGRFVVMGSSEWASNSFIGFNGNRDLALNTINWLASDEDLISIRPKDRDDRGITLTHAQMSWIRITSQFLLPLIVVLSGVSVWWRRR